MELRRTLYWVIWVSGRSRDGWFRAMVDRRGDRSRQARQVPAQRSGRKTVTYTITLAREADVPLLPAIELAAARLLAGHAPEAVLSETTSERDLDAARRLGHLWVALVDNEPVGFAHLVVLEPASIHLEELDVHPEHGRRGLDPARRVAMRRSFTLV